MKDTMGSNHDHFRTRERSSSMGILFLWLCAVTISSSQEFQHHQHHLTTDARTQALFVFPTTHSSSSQPIKPQLYPSFHRHFPHYALTSPVTDWDQIPKTPSSSPNNQQHNVAEWKFFDTARIHANGGSGGNGCVAFRRELGEARGGPSGGRGGSGGSVYLVCDPNMNTLAPLRSSGQVHFKGRKGNNGQGKGRVGSCAEDLEIKVPAGTVVRELGGSNRVAGELREDGDRLLVANGGRGGRGNAAFKTHRYTAPKIVEKGEPGAARWLNLELKLVADVGFLGKPNAGKSTLLAAASAARPKIANYPFTTIVPNLGVCDLIGEGGIGGGRSLVLCDIPGLIEGASSGVGLGLAFLRHVQRCKVLLHVIDGTSDDPVDDFVKINRELKEYNSFLAQKPQVVVLNKVDVTEVREKEAEIMAQLREAAGHTRVLSISAVTTERVKELMERLKKFVETQPDVDLPELPEVDFSVAGLDCDSDDFEILSDPAYPSQWRVKGAYIEQVAKMTHWEYPEAIERFGRQLQALGIAEKLEERGAVDGDLVMVDEYDFDFAPGKVNPYLPEELLERDIMLDGGKEMVDAYGQGILVDEEEKPQKWRPFRSGGYMDEDPDELVGFNDASAWTSLDEIEEGQEEFSEYFPEDGDEIWTP